MSIYESVCLVQAHDEAALLGLINKFNPLLKSYARKMGSEDAYNDLLVDFLGLLYEINTESFLVKSDGAFVNYFQRSVYRFYTKHLKQKIKSIPVRSFSEMSEEELYFLDVITSNNDRYFQDEIIEDLAMLTEHEKKILQLFYVERQPISVIAKTMGSSRQAVNQAKIRAYRRLKESISARTFQ